MDGLITAAARALAAGDPLSALNQVALRDDAPALALRGIAMAQLGDLVRANALLRSATRAFGPSETVARARGVVAEAEIALASRDLGWPAKALGAARAALARAEHAAGHARIPALTYRARNIHQVDPRTGAILRTIESKRFVTGVTWIDGELWYATWEGDERDQPSVLK